MNISLFHLFLESKGGLNRGHIVNLINKSPSNTYKISKELNLNYKTVQHHLKILQENNVIECEKTSKYGALCFISDKFDIDQFMEIYNILIDGCSADNFEDLKEKALKMLK